MIPTSKVQQQAIQMLFRFPKSVRVSDRFPPEPGADILICTYQAMNLYYYKYSVFGTNVILFNFLPFIGISVILGYAVPNFVEHFPIPMFICCLISTVPLSYYIGKAVSSISAQTSFALGALLNATFGSMIELILYFIALNKGLVSVVQQAVTGALLNSMLLMPGVSMIFGGIAHKEQFFNKNAAGVSAVLLLIAMIGAYMPTLFYQIYGNYELTCNQCFNVTAGINCGGCEYKEKSYIDDPVFISQARPLMYVCAAILPV